MLPLQSALRRTMHIFRNAPYEPNINTTTPPSATKHRLFDPDIETTTVLLQQQHSTMAGGKGKSSGGKSSGGKVGADSGKKQQSHSSKAGLQVSNAQKCFFTESTISHQFGVFPRSISMFEDAVQPPRHVASAEINRGQQVGQIDTDHQSMRQTQILSAMLSISPYHNISSGTSATRLEINKPKSGVWRARHACLELEMALSAVGALSSPISGANFYVYSFLAVVSSVS